jgi:hypothetical protein
VEIRRRMHKCKRGSIKSSHWTEVLKGGEREEDL